MVKTTSRRFTVPFRGRIATSRLYRRQTSLEGGNSPQGFPNRSTVPLVQAPASVARRCRSAAALVPSTGCPESPAWRKKRSASRIVRADLPGTSCGPSPEGGTYRDIHVGLKRARGDDRADPRRRHRGPVGRDQGVTVPADPLSGQLDFLYTPSDDVAGTRRTIVEVLGGRLVFAIEGMGTRSPPSSSPPAHRSSCSPTTWTASGRSSCIACPTSRPHSTPSGPGVGRRRGHSRSRTGRAARSPGRRATESRCTSSCDPRSPPTSRAGATSRAKRRGPSASVRPRWPGRRTGPGRTGAATNRAAPPCSSDPRPRTRSGRRWRQRPSEASR
jgi:hypothetical protein